MKLAIMQPYFFPYIGYFQLINYVDTFVFYDDVNYIKQGWINRNNIVVKNNKFLFTIPLENPSSFSKINEINICDKLFYKWKRKFLLTIEQSYKNAPYFKPVYELINKCLSFEGVKISEFSVMSVMLVCDYLNLDTKMIATSSKYKNNQLRAQDRVIDICLAENATSYINPIGGKELYSKTTFDENGIELKILHSKSKSYKQFGEEFMGSLSIIDVLMFNSIEETKVLLNEFDFYQGGN